MKIKYIIENITGLLLTGEKLTETEEEYAWLCFDIVATYKIIKMITEWQP